MTHDDHEVIYLAPACNDCFDRDWCQDDQGPCEECGLPWVKYVRADVVPPTPHPTAEAMRIVTTEMADAWEDARPRRRGPYKDDADERQAYAEGNWLAMLEACDAYRHFIAALSSSASAAEAMRATAAKFLAASDEAAP